MTDMTKSIGHEESVPLALLLRHDHEGSWEPKLEDDVATLGVVLHAFIANRAHYLLGRHSPQSFKQGKSEYARQLNYARVAKLLRLEHMNKKPDDRLGPFCFTDAMDLILLMVDERNHIPRYSIRELTQHPLLKTDNEVCQLLNLVKQFVESDANERLKKSVMHGLEVYDPKEPVVAMIIASLPHGLRELCITDLSNSVYRNLLLGSTGTGQANMLSRDFKDRGWASAFAKSSHEWNNAHIFRKPKKGKSDYSHPLTRDYRTISDMSTRIGGCSVPVFFSVVELIVAFRNLTEHPEGALRNKSDVARFVRTNYPFLLSHVWHVLLAFKEELSVVADAELYNAAFSGKP